MFLALSSFDLFLADESGVAFSLSLLTEGEITFVGGSLSVSASEVTSRYIQREKEREEGEEGEREKERISRYVRPVSLRGQILRSRVLLSLTLSACLPDLM